MNWIYRNNNSETIIYRDITWLPDEEHETVYPIPSSLGLSCIQQGSTPDPILFHSDITVPAGENVTVDIDAPALSHNVALSIRDMTVNSACECRFNHEANKPIPIDARGFSQVLAWELCSRLVLTNTTDNNAVISVTAIEVGV